MYYGLGVTENSELQKIIIICSVGKNIIIFYFTALIQTSASSKLNLKRKILLAVKDHRLLYFGQKKN